MEPKWARLLEQVEAFCQDRAELERSRIRGQPPDLPRLFHVHRALLHPDLYFEWQEASKGAAGLRRLELERACLFLLEVAAQARAARACLEIDQWEVRATPFREEPETSIREAFRRIALEPVRARRVLLARTLEREIADQPAYARQIQARFEAAEGRGFGSVDALASTFDSSLSPHLEEAEAFLRLTEDGYRDLLAYAVRRSDAAVSQPDLFDLFRATWAPWTFGELSRGEVLHATGRWLDGWGLLRGAGRVEAELTDAPNRAEGPELSLVRVPQAIFLSVRVTAGVGDTLRLLRGQGAALGWALRDERLPVDVRRWAAPEAPLTLSTLFGAFSLDARWCERTLHAGRTQARELARLFAFAELARLRALCGQVRFEHDLWTAGLSGEAPDAWEGELRRALRVSVPRGFALRTVQAPWERVAELKAATLGHPLAAALRERFDEDYWRNPAAAAFLREWSAGPERSSELLSKVLPEPAGRRLQGVAPGLLAALGA